MRNAFGSHPISRPSPSELVVKRKAKALKITGIVLAAMLGLVLLFLALFDWNLLRPYINRKVSEAMSNSAEAMESLHRRGHTSR